LKKFTAVTIASVAAIALFLTGCSQVGAAATIGSTKITQATVQTSIDTVMAERTGVDTTQMQLETGEELNRSQLRFHLFAGLLKAAATSIKVKVTKAEIDTRREVIIQQVGGVANLPQALVGAGIASSDFDIYLEAVLNSEKIQQNFVAAGVPEADIPTKMQELIVAIGKTNKVTVNPRYGVWNPETAEVTAAPAAVVSSAEAVKATSTACRTAVQAMADQKNGKLSDAQIFVELQTIYSWAQKSAEAGILSWTTSAGSIIQSGDSQSAIELLSEISSICKSAGY
jgi:hypothetical protein